MVISSILCFGLLSLTDGNEMNPAVTDSRFSSVQDIYWNRADKNLAPTSFKQKSHYRESLYSVSMVGRTWCSENK